MFEGRLHPANALLFADFLGIFEAFLGIFSAFLAQNRYFLKRSVSFRIVPDEKGVCER